MGFKYTHRVYNDVHDTSATEQQVLAVLAHFADDKIGFCFPSQGTLARQSHLHPATIKRRLNSLKKKGYLEWIPGGRKINGRSVSNLYKLRLPKPQPKREEMQLAEFWETVDNSKSSGAQCAAHSAPPPRRTVRPLPSAQCALYPVHSAPLSYIEHPKIIPMIITRLMRVKICRGVLSLVLLGGTVRSEMCWRR